MRRNAQPRVPGRSMAMTVSIRAQPASGTAKPMRKLPAYRETTPTSGGTRALPKAASANITPPTFLARVPYHLESQAIRKGKMQNGKNAGKAESCEKSSTEQSQVRVTRQKNRLPRGCEKKSSDRNRNLSQVKKNGRRSTSAAKEPGKEEHRRQRPGVAAPWRGSLRMGWGPVGGPNLRTNIDKKQNPEQPCNCRPGHLTAARS